MVSRLSHLDEDQISQLITRANHLRSRSAKKNTEERDTIDTWIERVLKKDEREFSNAQTTQGIVVGVTSQVACVELLDTIIEARFLSTSAVVGDIANVAKSADGKYALISIEPRRTRLTRPDVDGSGAERIIVANVDIIVIVVSVVAPPLHPRLIDRYLVGVRRGGAEPVICVNKMDLNADRSELEKLSPYAQAGAAIIPCSTIDAEGLDALRAKLAGRVCAFVGHSGVGKSSLLNALKPDAQQKIGAVSATYGRGTHTTTASSLHHLDGGTILIDTPGIRRFGLKSLGEEELRSYFPEIAEVSCHFTDCSHIHEPKCRVIEKVEHGEIPHERYEMYIRLREELTQ